MGLQLRGCVAWLRSCLHCQALRCCQVHRQQMRLLFSCCSCRRSSRQCSMLQWQLLWLAAAQSSWCGCRAARALLQLWPSRI